ncbi:MurR/RpiR family transcriptional regulator [Nocardioides sp. NPDC004968]|uniref:MurR/RpiR family transcriptional regulator n=1 Tax=Nocardioides sp. NPDC004968 TaxID=3155894 RepID=UPI0033A062B9
MTVSTARVDQRIDRRIAANYQTLSPQERKAADTLLEHLDDLATYRAAELASLAEVSKATMSRLFRSLGFDGFDEVRDHLRGLRTAGEPRRVEGAPDLSAHAEGEAAAIARVVEQAGIAEAIEAIAGASDVMVTGWRNSYPVALHLRQQLTQTRERVTLAPAPGQVIGEELAELGEGSVVVAVGLRRRPPGFGEFVDAAASSGSTVIVIADPTGTVHLGRADIALECPVQGALAFDSLAAPMSLASVLADGVLHERGRAGRDRVSTISATYDRLHEVE